MPSRKSFGFIVLWILSLILVGAWSYAQAPIPEQLVPLTTPIIVSGNDIGFRVEARRGGVPVGRWVIRNTANGQWIEPQASSSDVKRLASR